MQGTILKQIVGTSLGPSQTAPQKQPTSTIYRPTTISYTSGSAITTINNATLLGAGGGQTYTETAFKAAAAYNPPVTRQPVASMGFTGGGRVPGGPGPVPPVPVGYFVYQNGVTYFDIVNDEEYYVTQQ